jgi:PAS domain-containing protein
MKIATRTEGLVTYPDTVVSHTRQQTCYFDDTGLLRRLDYTADLLGGGPAVHYPSRYREFDGIMISTRCRIYARNPDGSAARDSVSVAIDITEVALS